MPSKELALQWLASQKIKDADVWLAQQGGAPLAALAMAQSENMNELDNFLRSLSQPSVDMSLKCAEQVQKMEMTRTISWMQRWLYDIFSFKQSKKIRYYPRYQVELSRLAERASNDALMKIIKSLQDRQALANHPLSPKLLIEDMLLEYSEIFK